MLYFVLEIEVIEVLIEELVYFEKVLESSDEEYDMDLESEFIEDID